MSERTKWMPSSLQILLALKDLMLDPVTGEVIAPRNEALHRLTGLRAQLAALEELIAGQTGHMVDRAKAMIEEIRKEIG